MQGDQPLMIEWHFLDEEVADLPGNFVLPRTAGQIAPQIHDVIVFDGLPDGVTFLVDFRRLHYRSRNTETGEQVPPVLHVFLSCRRRTAPHS